MKALLLIGMFLFQQAQLQPTGMIVGRILFSDGLPAVRAEVRATVSAPTTTAAPFRVPAFTDESGNYRIDRLAAGTYTVRAVLSGSTVFYPGVTAESQATPVTLALGASVNNIDIVIPDSLSGVRVSGRVTFPAGQTLPAVPPRVQMNSSSAPLAADGSFEFRHVLPGNYSVSFPAPGIQPLRIVVGNRDVTDVMLAVPRIVSVSGTVSAEGGTRPPLSILFEGPGGRTGIAVQPNGTFSTQLPEGPYLVTVVGADSSGTGRAPSPLPFPAGYYLASFGNETQNLLAGLLKVTPADPSVRLSLALGRSAGVKVAGRVKSSAEGSQSVPAKVVFSSAPVAMNIEALVNGDGVFEVPRLMPGTYTTSVVFKTDVRSTPMTVVIPNRDLSDLDLAIPAPIEITGRVAVDGNGPPPKFQLAFVRGGNIPVNLNAPLNQNTDLLVAARSGGSHVLMADVNPLPDGSFRMTLPPGDYQVIPGLQAPAYFIRSFTHGRARLLTEPLHVSDSERAELHVGFGTAAPNPWKKVSGRVVGIDAANGPPRISLESGGLATIEATVNPDGTFEFLRVLPGTTYIPKLIPANDAASSPPVSVVDKDVEGVEIVIPREGDVSIKASVEGNAPVPTFILSLGAKSALIKPEADGTFTARLPQDERRILISGYPFGYLVKSMTYGSLDLRRNPVRLNSTPPTAIHVTFAVDPSVPFGNLQGRVTGLDPDQRGVKLVLNGASSFATFEAELGATGSFSFSKIPQGTYVPTLEGGMTSGLLTPPSITVTGRDLAGIEINYPRGSSRPGQVDAGRTPSGTTMNDLSDINSLPSRKAANESAAVANLRTVNVAQITYLAASGGRYGTISDLISAGLLDSTFGGTKAGFNFAVVAAESEYAAVAIPASGDLARYGFFSTPDAVVRYSPLDFLSPARRSGNPVQ